MRRRATFLPVALVALLAPLGAIAPVASLLHESVAPHRFCAEHEVVEESAAETSTLPVAGLAVADATLEVGPGEGHDDGDDPARHHRCPFVTLCEAPVTTAEMAQLRGPRVAVTALAAGPVHEAPPSARSILASAPKTSPPV